MSVPPDRLDASITIRPYSSAVSQDLPDGVPKYKALLQEEDIRSNNMATLLRILCFLGGADIPEIMLSRASSPHKSWGVTGEIEEVTLFGAGFYIDLLADAAETNNTIHSLASHALITKTEGSFQKRGFSVDKKLQLYVVQSTPNPDEWKRDALILVCHTFPRDRDSEPL